MAVDHPYPGVVLKFGSRGPRVRELQRQLNTFDGRHLDEDGEFGEETEKKVSAFQAHRHLGASGEVDVVIWDRLFGNPPPALHPREHETEDAKLRRLREEAPVRERQIAQATGARRHELEQRLEAVTDAIERLVAPKHPKIEGNSVKGGNPRERLIAGARAAAQLEREGKRHSFYEQEGHWTADFAITGEARRFRSDCSQWITSLFKSCGLPDPNANQYRGGYTGTLATHCRRIERGQLHPGDLVFFGAPPYHHVELYVGPADQTIGHGSAPVDGGTIHLLAEPHFYTAF